MNVGSIKFPNGGRFKFDPEKKDYFSTTNHSVRGRFVGNRFGVYAGGLRPNLEVEKIDLGKIMEKHGSLLNYLRSTGNITNGEDPKVIGVFFAGGPAPSANAVFYGITMEAYRRGMRVLAFEDGCEGILKGKGVMLTPHNVWGIHRQGDVLIGTSRKNPSAKEREQIKNFLDKLGVSGLIGIGGDDTNTTLVRLGEMGIPVIGVPKTIDNDLPKTDITFGHTTVIEASSRELSSLINDARSRNAIYIAKVMGRTSGSWTISAGMAAGATRTIIGEEYSKEGILQLMGAHKKYSALDPVLRDICEVIRVNGEKVSSPEDLKERLQGKDSNPQLTINLDALAGQIKELIDQRATKGYHYALITVAEGLADKLQTEVTERDGENKPIKGIISGIGTGIAYDEFGNPRLSDVKIADILVKRVKQSTKATILAAPDTGYQYRSEEVPASFDINLSQGLGVEAITMAAVGDFGKMVRIKDNDISSVNFSDLPRDPDTGHIIPRVVRLDKFPYIYAKTMEYAKKFEDDPSKP